ncbi:PCI domain-containing protein [Aphelenchoides besseyi]|nr:PCI domain-containing protein [Aphelenchoides besseyi]KAI6194037.1 PCI domain-containing protein [Aphelenchoides besseyi]
MPEDRRVTVSPIPVEKPKDNRPQNADELAAFTSQNIGDGKLVKMEVDYAPQVDEALPKADQLAKTNVSSAIDSLVLLEKQSRLGADMRSNSRILRHMVKLAFEAKNWNLLNETIVTMSKKRALIKFAIKNMVQDCCEMVDKLPNETERNRLVETLRTVTAGKIYVEVERARLSMRIAKKLEAEGKMEDAWNILIELQVETFGSMEVKEKVRFLLDQMRLSIQRKDFVRAAIISNKISTKFFEDKSDEVQDLKLEFYTYKIAIGLNDNNYLDVCRHYRCVFDTPKVQADDGKVKEILKNVVVYVLLSPYGSEQWDQVHRIHAIRQLELVPEYNSLLELFINEEIIGWKDTIVSTYEQLLRKGTPASAAPPNVFTMSEDGEKRWKAFKERVGEHNIRMIAKYYTQITFDRMAELLEFPVDEMEAFLCKLIVTGVIPDAKIHRPSRIINLRARKANIETLDNWGSNVRKLTDILNKVSHLVSKEEMVHRHLDDQKILAAAK